MDAIKQAVNLITNFREELANYLLLKAVDMYEASNETMATMPDWTLAYQGAKLHSTLADMYVELAKAIARDID